MSEDAERIKRLIAFKKKIETRIVELDSELKEQQAMLETVNSFLLEKGFRRAEVAEGLGLPRGSSRKEKIVAEGPEPISFAPQPEPENITSLKTVAGEPLANLYANEDSLRVVPAEDKNFDINTPPFTHFLVERVLLKMQERDSELVRAKQLAPDKIFCYNIVREGNIIREIVVKNVDSERMRELKSSIRWTLEKMYEKMKTPS
jgi:predicted XRE-type DNA-binding protein